MMFGVFVHTSTLGQSQLLSAMAKISGLVRMEAFFIVSGFLSLMLVRKYGGRKTVLKRLTTIGIPLAATLTLLNPVTNYLIYTYHNGHISVISYFAEGSIQDPIGPMVWHLHLWFLFALIAYGLITPLLARSVDQITVTLTKTRRLANDPERQLLMLFSAVPLACLAMRAVFELSLDQALTSSPLRFVVRATFQYLPFFFFGMILYANPRLLENFYSRSRWIQLGISVALLFGARFAFDHLPKIISEAAVLVSEAYFSIIASSFLFKFFRWLVPAENQVYRYMSDASYSVYLFHFALIYVGAWGLRPILTDGHLLYLSVIVWTFGSALLIHSFIIARSPLLRAVFNGKLPVRMATRTELPAVSRTS